jgi:hypothetical protein
MYLSIILTIFVVLQITTLILIYKWWNKYGRNLINSFLDMKKGFQNPLGTSNTTNPWNKMPDMGEMMRQLDQMTKMMGKK